MCEGYRVLKVFMGKKEWGIIRRGGFRAHLKSIRGRPGAQNFMVGHYDWPGLHAALYF